MDQAWIGAVKLVMGILMAGCVIATGEQDKTVTPPLPAGVTWEDLYHPPYKVPTELPAGSELRKQMFDSLRSKLRPGLRFEGKLRAFKNWAFFKGKCVDAKGEPARMSVDGSSAAIGLWLRTSTGWNLVDYSAGDIRAKDRWAAQFNVPAELLIELDKGVP